jgi:predicted RNase H-like nuclease (RuvC/YqgF family)
MTWNATPELKQRVERLEEQAACGESLRERRVEELEGQLQDMMFANNRRLQEFSDLIELRDLQAKEILRLHGEVKERDARMHALERELRLLRRKSELAASGAIHRQRAWKPLLVYVAGLAEDRLNQLHLGRRPRGSARPE